MAQLIDRVIHIRFDGRSEELTTRELNLAPNANDGQIKQAVARYFDLSGNYLQDYVVVHNSTSIIIRPEAIYG